MSAEVRDKQAHFKFADDQAALILNEIGSAPQHADAYGRIAFACPAASVSQDIGG